MWPYLALTKAAVTFATVRSNPEYSSTIWSPYQPHYIDKIESVQKGVNELESVPILGEIK